MLKNQRNSPPRSALSLSLSLSRWFSFLFLSSISLCLVFLINLSTAHGFDLIQDVLVVVVVGWTEISFSIS